MAEMSSHVHCGMALRLAATIALMASCAAHANDLVYEPTNPSFGGNPFNSAHLLGIANAQNDYKDPSATDRTDPSQQFLRTLQSRLLSTLATQITDVIFGEGGDDNGTIQFGDQQITYVRGADDVTITIFNGLDGTTTEIIVPLFESDGG